jgi:hypothetical protein
MRFQIWDFDQDRLLMAFPERGTALLYLRGLLGKAPAGRVNALGLVDKGGTGEVLTYPLEGAALLAAVFGLEEDA